MTGRREAGCAQGPLKDRALHGKGHEMGMDLDGTGLVLGESRVRVQELSGLTRCCFREGTEGQKHDSAGPTPTAASCRGEPAGPVGLVPQASVNHGLTLEKRQEGNQNACVCLKDSGYRFGV